ncbi:transcriptional regulator, LytTR family [Granulicatella balaenopterae]|uniref:Transcriptional regulator, LytTR family n=1 Tax=Granulicatella balaenopterae TaxID=137733 RepID=A0A1H9HFF5_9LACT|nr:LytTR family DNA-binding domain-containing protein [Granulicatella balaenopterae]SEQ61002.1 transcriptional regulator, LytTR family [Granulicatella balaenopterae]
MKINLDINPNYQETEVTIKASHLSDEVTRMLNLFNEEKNCDTLTVVKDERIILLQVADIYRIYAESGKVYVQTASDIFDVKMRLYEVEERFVQPSSSLIRISKSEIVNLKKVAYFEASFSGTMVIVLKNKQKAYVSRRFVKALKERIGV